MSILFSINSNFVSERKNIIIIKSVTVAIQKYYFYLLPVHQPEFHEKATLIFSIYTFNSHGFLQMIEVDPEGDVILLLGNGSVGIRASSRVLSLASTRFEAKLKNQGIDDPSKAEPAIIALPDDHVSAVTRLCHMLHVQCDDMVISFRLFEQLALL